MKNEQILQISPDDLIEREGWNVRLADDPDNIRHIAELAESIFHVGVLEPLTAYSNRAEPDDPHPRMLYTVENGHCRLAAVRQAIARGAPIKSIPVRLTDKRAGEADHNFAMIARNSGKSLSQLELGLVCKRLVGFGWSEEDLSQKTGYSLQHVRNCLTLASAPDEVTKLVETGQVSASLATQAVQAEGGEEAAKTLTAAVAEAKAEDAAKPKRRSAVGAAKSRAVAPVKATLKHVAKVKGVTRAAATKKAQYAPKAGGGESVGDTIRRWRTLNPVAALLQFDKLAKTRGQLFEELLNGWHADDMNQGNGRDPDLETLALTMNRAIAAASDDDPTITTVVLTTDDWETLCAVLKIKRPMEKTDPRVHAS